MADLITSNGADCLELSEEVRRELVMALQDSTNMEFAEGWMGNTLAQLASQLSNAWLIDSGTVE